MPQYLELGARVSERWSPGRLAKGELRRFTRAHRGPDDRTENGAGRAAAEERRWLFPAIRGGGGSADPDGNRCRGLERRRPALAHRRSAQLPQWLSRA